MTAHDLEFGLSLWLDHPVREYVPVAEEAERAGFADVWLPDHYFLRDVVAAQALMAAATSRIRLGTGVLGVPLRHPALVASSTATVNEIAGGSRVIVGLGTGGHEVPTELALRPKSPLGLVREAVDVIRGVLGGEGSTVDGGYFSTEDARLTYRAEQVPIYLAARGPKMMQLAGEVADGAIVHGLSSGYFEYVRKELAVGAERVGRAADSCEPVILMDVEIDNDESAAIDRLRKRTVLMAGGSYSDSMIPVYGLDPDDVARLRAAIANPDEDASRFVTDDMVRQFCLVGSPDRVAERLRELRAGGVRRAVVKLAEGDPAGIQSKVRDFATVISEVNR